MPLRHVILMASRPNVWALLVPATAQPKHPELLSGWKAPKQGLAGLDTMVAYEIHTLRAYGLTPTALEKARTILKPRYVDLSEPPLTGSETVVLGRKIETCLRPTSDHWVEASGGTLGRLEPTSAEVGRLANLWRSISLKKPAQRVWKPKKSAYDHLLGDDDG